MRAFFARFIATHRDRADARFFADYAVKRFGPEAVSQLELGLKNRAARTTRRALRLAIVQLRDGRSTIIRVATR